MRELEGDHYFYKTVAKTHDGPTQRGVFAKALHRPITLQESPCYFAVATPSCFEGCVMELPRVRTIFASAVHWSNEFLVTATMMMQETIPAGEVIGTYVGQVSRAVDGLFVLSRGYGAGAKVKHGVGAGQCGNFYVRGVVGRLDPAECGTIAAPGRLVSGLFM